MTREEAIDLLDNLIGFVEDNHGSDYDKALKIAIKALEQEPSTDAVSRQYLVDKIKELFEMGDCHCDKYSIIGTINQAPSVNPNVCIDAVSRQAVQEANTISIELKENPHQMWQRIQNLPSVTPTRPKGQWINNHTTCDKCGWQMFDDEVGSPNMVFFKFCPNCGADMREEVSKNDRQG